MPFAVAMRSGTTPSCSQANRSAGAGEAGLHLVGDEHDPVRVRPLDQCGQEPRRGHDEAALALDRLDHQRGEVLGADVPLEVLDAAGGRGGAVEAVAERVGHRRPVDLRRERAEPVLVRHVLGGHRHRQRRAAVVGVLEHRDGRAPRGQPRDLDGVLHRLRAGVEQRRALLVAAGGDRVERLGHGDVAVVRGDHETGVGERRHLVAYGLDHRGRAVADRGDGDARPEVDERVAVDVDDHAAARGRRVHRHDAAEAPATAAERRAASSRERGPGTSVTRRRTWGSVGPPRSAAVVAVMATP